MTLEMLLNGQSDALENPIFDFDMEAVVSPQTKLSN